MLLYINNLLQVYINIRLPFSSFPRPAGSISVVRVTRERESERDRESQRKEPESSGPSYISIKFTAHKLLS